MTTARTRIRTRRGLAFLVSFLVGTGALLGMVTSVSAADTCTGYQRKVEGLAEDGTATYDVVNSAGVKIGTITYDNVSEPERVTWEVASGYTLNVCVKGGDSTATGSGRTGTVNTPTEGGKTPAVSHFAWTVNEPAASPSPSPSPSPSASPSPSPSPSASASPSPSPSPSSSASPSPS